MANIILSGIPSVGKSKILEDLRNFSKSIDFNVYSLGDMMTQLTKNTLNLEKNKFVLLDQNIQKAIREGAINQIILNMNQYNSKNNIIESAMTLMDSYGIQQIVINSEQLRKINESFPIDYFVNIYGSPEKILNQFKNSYFPNSKQDILQWQTIEASTAENLRPNGSKFLVLPADNSSQSIAKLIYSIENEINPNVIYYAGPITHLVDNVNDSDCILEKKRKDRESMDDLENLLQKYSIVVSPIKIDDLNSSTRNEIEHVKFRDLKWFATQSDVLVAYFPGNYESKGTTAEINYTKNLGKNVILIHPNSDKETFAIQSDLHFRSKDEFLEKLDLFKNKGPMSKGEEILLYFFNNSGKPKYEKLY
ncbi:MAG: AAA family ATPase [Candidatus Woesearchaeota archaeon]